MSATVMPSTKVLVAVASKHGSTLTIAQALAEAIARHGCEVDVLAVDEVTTLAPYDSVVVGSAVYAGRWLKSAKTFLDRFDPELHAMPVWLFSSGPLGDPPLPAGDPPCVEDLMNRSGAKAHTLFPGRLTMSSLGLGERLVARTVSAPDGDFRSWRQVASCGDDIALQLARTRSSSRETAMEEQS